MPMPTVDEMCASVVDSISQYVCNNSELDSRRTQAIAALRDLARTFTPAGTRAELLEAFELEALSFRDLLEGKSEAALYYNNVTEAASVVVAKEHLEKLVRLARMMGR